jgi:AcrR family transcriptional regulator
MPKIVDHDARREEILQAAMRVIRTVGLDGTTTRAIAREAGYSSGGLSHYFADKDDILRSVLVMTHRRSRQRQAEALAGKKALDKLWGLLLDNLPLDEERSVETLMEMTFWPRAVSSPELRKFQHDAAHALLANLRQLIGEVREAGQLTSELSDAELAEVLIGVIDGFSVHYELFPERLPPANQERLMLAQLQAFGFAVADLDG